MNTREAILRAADHLAENPKRLDFSRVRMPQDPNDTGCVLGWIGYFMGAQPTMIDGLPYYLTRYNSLGSIERKLGWRYEGDFFDEMNKLQPFWEKVLMFRPWFINGKGCAKTLRRYADRYHPAAKRPRVTDTKIIDGAAT